MLLLWHLILSKQFTKQLQEDGAPGQDKLFFGSLSRDQAPLPRDALVAEHEPALQTLPSMFSAAPKGTFFFLSRD